MNANRTVLSLPLFLLLGACASMGGASGNRGAASWRIAGDLEEACSCNPACPCWFDAKPTRMTCSGAQVLFIRKGELGGVRLDGLAVANVVQSPEGRSMTESFGD